MTIDIQRCKQRQWDIYIQWGKQMTMRCIQRCKQRQWDIYKDVKKGNRDDPQRCKLRQWDIYKDVNKGNEIYTKM